MYIFFINQSILLSENEKKKTFGDIMQLENLKSMLT